MLPPIVGSAARTKRPSLDRFSRVCKEALLAEAKAVTRCRRAAWAPSRAGPHARQWRLAGIGNPNAFSGEIRRACGIRERAEVAKRVRGWEGISVVMREGSRTFPGGPEGQVMAAGSGRGAGRGSSLGAGRTGAGWSYALRRRGTWSFPTILSRAYARLIFVSTAAHPLANPRLSPATTSLSRHVSTPPPDRDPRHRSRRGLLIGRAARRPR
jgi:hypothetical protein